MVSSVTTRLAGAFGFTVNGENRIVFGKVEGYPVSAAENAAQRLYYLTFPARPGQGEPALLPQDFLAQLKAQNKQIAGVMVEGHALHIAVKMGSYSKTLAAFQGIFEAAAGYFRQYGFVPCCMGCGAAEELGIYALQDCCRFFCGDCAAGAETRLQEMAARRAKIRSNLPMGLLGAFLGSLVGVAAWILVFQLGYIAGIIGLLMFFCALKGYEKLGGCLDIKGLAAATVVPLIMVLVALYLCYGIEVFKVYGEDGYNFFQCLAAVPAVLEVNDLGVSFVKDLIIGWLFTGAAGAGTFINTFRSLRGDVHVTRLG